jgi:type IV secretion system protein VirB5
MSNSLSNPYLAARAEWLERYGGYIKSRNQWRMTAFVCLTMAILSVGGNVIQTLQHKVVPYVVEVDRLGKVIAVERADQVGAVPPRVIQASIATSISDWRTVTADFSLQEKMIKRLSAHIAGPAKGVLKAWYEQNSPYERAKDMLIGVKIKGVPLPVSAESWRIEWTETIRNHSGVAMLSASYEATIAISITPPTTEDRILKNPMGVYIIGLSWAELINQGVKQ